MIRIKKTISKLVSGICSVFLALIGYSCSKSDDSDNFLCMYGMPTGSFEIKGSVTTQEGEKVNNAEIRVAPPYFPSGECSDNEITITDHNGSYDIECDMMPLKSIKVVCLPCNSNLEADSVVVDMHYIKDPSQKDNSWYIGHAEETVNFTLKEKKQPE
ncbi:MAG: radical SAM-associated putative lipoprotein [Muribaculaceae bacterium]|nr:radical SAM-associated putative lipoprotein [Muribaculaceae bacterium]